MMTSSHITMTDRESKLRQALNASPYTSRQEFVAGPLGIIDDHAPSEIESAVSGRPIKDVTLPLLSSLSRSAQFAASQPLNIQLELRLLTNIRQLFINMDWAQVALYPELLCKLLRRLVNLNNTHSLNVLCLWACVVGYNAQVSERTLTLAHCLLATHAGNNLRYISLFIDAGAHIATFERDTTGLGPSSDELVAFFTVLARAHVARGSTLGWIPAMLGVAACEDDLENSHAGQLAQYAGMLQLAGRGRLSLQVESPVAGTFVAEMALRSSTFGACTLKNLDKYIVRNREWLNKRPDLLELVPLVRLGVRARWLGWFMESVSRAPVAQVMVYLGVDNLEMLYRVVERAEGVAISAGGGEFVLERAESSADDAARMAEWLCILTQALENLEMHKKTQDRRERSRFKFGRHSRGGARLGLQRRSFGREV